MTVSAILSQKGRQVVTMGPKQPLREVCETLTTHKIGAVVLIDEHGRIAGILSERDIVKVLADRGAAALDDPVHAVMTRDVVSCAQNDTVGEIMEVMTSQKFRHLPVLDGDDRVVGLISIGDIVKWRLREYEHEQQALHDYIKSA